MTTSSRLIWIDALRLMAGLSMVGLHATSDPNGNPWPDYDVAQRILPILLRSILYIARTELFIIIAIFLLILSLDRRPRPYPTVLSEQFQRLMLPFLFWTFFYAGYNYFKANALGYGASWHAEVTQIRSWISFLTIGDVKYHMHFIPTLFGILLLYPLYVTAAKFPVLGITVLLFLLAKSHLDAFIYSTFWSTESLPYLVRFSKILTYAGYGMVAASLYSLYKMQSKKNLSQVIYIVLLSGMILFLFKLISGYKTIQLGVYPHTYVPGYWADFLMPVVLFGFCLLLSSKRWPNWLSKFGKYSFGLYLCHPIFLDIAEILTIDISWNPISIVLCKIAITVPGTVIILVLLQKSKYFAWTIGLGQRPIFTTNVTGRIDFER